MAKKASSSEPDVVALAKKFLRAGKDACEEIDEREFWDEEEAHDDRLIERTYRQFLGKMKAYQKLLAAAFGEPSVVGMDEHDAIPCNGVLEHVVWDIYGKSLFLAVSHEDRELPCLILLGVSQRPSKQTRRKAPPRATTKKAHQQVRGRQTQEIDRRGETSMDELLKLLKYSRLPDSGVPGVDKGWFHLAPLALPSGMLWAGDPEFSWAELRSGDGLHVPLPAGDYRVDAFVVAFGPWHAVARLRVCRTGIEEPTLGEEVGQAGTDSALVAVCDAQAGWSAFAAKFGDDKDAPPRFLERYNYRRAGLLHPNGPAGAALVYANSGFGDGAGPAYELRQGTKRVGVEFVFIEPGAASA